MNVPSLNIKESWVARELKHDRQLFRAQFSSDGKFIAAGGQDKLVRGCEAFLAIIAVYLHSFAFPLHFLAVALHVSHIICMRLQFLCVLHFLHIPLAVSLHV